MLAGWFFAVCTGLGMPAFVLFMGDIVDAFGPLLTADEMLEEMEF